MQIERFYLGCLAHASYLVHDNGEAAVIDPQRDVDLYIDEAQKLGLSIRWVIETHLHADFVSGHLELAQRTGASIGLGAGSGARFEHRELRDGDELPLGSGFLRILSTPGHTEESVCILAIAPDRPTQPVAVFTGDTLFIGDVGRPDLSPTKTPQQLAALLFDSLHQKLLALPDDTPVYPAHGAGSLCGRQMSHESSSTIGKERITNYALQAAGRQQFVDMLTEDLPPRPAYFQDEVARNRSGAPPLEELPPLSQLPALEAADLQSGGAIVLDTRPVIQYAAAHVPGSVHIALSGQFASWAARVMGIDRKIILLAEDDEAVQESRIRLARVGIENLAGAITGGIAGWIAAGNPVQSASQISVQELDRWFREDPANKTLLDVRDLAERSAGSIPGSISIPLPELQKRSHEIDRRTTVFVHCKSGYRSSIATSLLQSEGFPAVVNITGGYDAWSLSFPALEQARV
jgi:glyoxylase-like metal-dependent hydrolase (beta-lactamase superfamily II)/rhodanese-related sulfurtransferase